MNLVEVKVEKWQRSKAIEELQRQIRELGKLHKDPYPRPIDSKQINF